MYKKREDVIVKVFFKFLLAVTQTSATLTSMVIIIYVIFSTNECLQE